MLVPNMEISTQRKMISLLRDGFLFVGEKALWIER